MRGKMVKRRMCTPITLQCHGCGVPNRLSSDVHKELSQPWPLPALLGQKQGSDCRWAPCREVWRSGDSTVPQGVACSRV